ncbi:MAG: L,D-transpeptidase family protein [Hydrogenovibrio sp.]|uniref:L,D-transpeptidase family protein n=1 Tax=Hydrogenovibrio sp. TaxID=2065821 RepID=UPI0028708222|nr:L,D-transpeptidase family protein [Hydrogenovibrio sp.]MDR9498467.1 L,D-transpeptidase family protein [Hydrogenovibrio sp.]
MSRNERLMPFCHKALLKRLRPCLAACGLALSSPLLAQDGFTLLAEEKLLTGLSALEQGALEPAVTDLSQLAADMPEYKLAQLLKAELLAIKAGQNRSVLAQRERHAKTVDALVTEAKVRWRQNREALSAQQRRDDILSQYVLKTSQEPFLVIVDAEAHRLFLYQQQENGYEEVGSYYVTLGEKGTGKQVRGDKKTPVGVYQIIKQLPDETLPELYGVGALTLNYPNTWDKGKGRTGSGIWLHGTPRTTYSRPPLASRGCVVLNNPAMENLLFRFGLNQTTPVIIAEKTPVRTQAEINDHKQSVLTRINQWLREDSPYQVDWSEVSVYAYPGELGVYYVSFPVGNEDRVEQYWREADQGRWQLVYENTIPAANLPRLSRK